MKVEMRDPLQDIGADEPLPLDFVLDRRRQVRDQIYEALRRAIITLKLPPRAAISENRICRQVGVSRTPVREAIIRLVEDELIEVFPQQGSFVAPIKIGKIRESHFVRKCLELGVLKAAMAAWTPAASARMRELLRQQAETVDTNDVERFHALDEEFHRQFSEIAGLTGVWNTILGAKARVDRVHRLAVIEGRIPAVVREHSEVIDAIDAGDGEHALAAMDLHLDMVMTLLDLLIERNSNYFAN